MCTEIDYHEFVSGSEDAFPINPQECFWNIERLIHLLRGVYEIDPHKIPLRGIPWKAFHVSIGYAELIEVNLRLCRMSMTTLSSDTLNWAISHLERFYDTDIFPRVFEYSALSHCRDDVVAALARQDICQWNVRPFRQCLVPKQRLGFRIATQLDPLDMLMYLSLVLEIGDEVEQFRVGADQNVSFSSRFLMNDDDFHMFNPDYGYSQFNEYSTELSQRYPYVVLTDIADFYPRIYFHRLENALDEAITNLCSHRTAILNLIRGWNQRVSYGIPVGNNPSRLLAELVITDLDQPLLSEGMVFSRYVDDFRIFCSSREDAYRCLSRLARILYDVHGMTLQSHKTQVLSSDQFIADVIESPERGVLDNLSERFRGILLDLGFTDPYSQLEIDYLPEEVQEQIRNLNLVNMLEEQIQTEDYHIPTLKFLINRLAWLRNHQPVDAILSNIDNLYPVFSEVIRYLASLTTILDDNEKESIGAQILSLLDGSVVSQLEYHRTLAMGLFAGSASWRNQDAIPGFYMTAQDDWMRRSVLLAIGKAGQYYSIRAQKTRFDQMPPWEKRAFIYSASCLPRDEKNNWYQAVRPRLDMLDQYVIDWARANPINQ